MSGTVRIIHRPDPARPKAPDGIIEVEVNGEAIRMPHKGHDKVISVQQVKFHVHDEASVKKQEL